MQQRANFGPMGPHGAHVAVLPYQHDPCGCVAIPSRPAPVLPYHHDPCLCCHTGTISGPCVAIPARYIPVSPHRHYLGPHGAPMSPHGPPRGPRALPDCGGRAHAPDRALGKIRTWILTVQWVSGTPLERSAPRRRAKQFRKEAEIVHGGYFHGKSRFGTESGPRAQWSAAIAASGGPTVRQSPETLGPRTCGAHGGPQGTPWGHMGPPSLSLARSLIPTPPGNSDF